jgi:pyruvate kinase
MHMKKRTKIVCTIGPACMDKSVIREMVRQGMNVARLNFSHGTHADHEMMIHRIRQVEKETHEPIAIMQDLQGPKIRIGMMPDDGVDLAQGKAVVFDTSLKKYAGDAIPLDYPELHQFMKKGERIFIADGKIEARVTRVQGTKIEAKMAVAGRIFSHKGINVPDTTLGVRALTEKDQLDLRFGVAHDVDLVALSFVRTPDDVLHARELIIRYEKEFKKKPDQSIAIIAKIERGEAVENIEKILEVTDGIMVARGDLGVEVPAAEVPLIQKKLIDLALQYARPVIVATQMLDSMQENPRATRAEVSDVANAVIDHTDAVMLSNETATGKYPVETVETMATIIRETEASTYDDLPMVPIKKGEQKKNTDDVVSELSRMLAERVDAAMIMAASLTGETGRLISRYRPELPIFVGTSSKRTEHQLNLSWGVLPFTLLPCDSIEELIQRAFTHLKKARYLKTGDKVVVVAGEPVGSAGHVNLLEIRQVE